MGTTLKTHYVRVGTGALGGEGYLRAIPGVRRIINQELSVVGEAALGEAQGFVDIAGTDRAWFGSFPDLHQGGGSREESGRGRVNTGALRRALDFRVYAGEGVGLDVGWIHESSYEDYMGEQEHGFVHKGYRKHDQQVRGMGMFQHLRVYMRGRISDAADRIMDRITSGF